MRVAILGGGQLGKMLCIAAAPLDIKTLILDEADDFPAARLCHQFYAGSFKDYDDVLRIGRDADVITVEIEHVNTDALRQLVAEGKQVHPHPDILDTIKDKGLQKQFYARHDIPTSDFQLFEDTAAVKTALSNGHIVVPFVQKSRLAGYDGKGVHIVRTDADLDGLIPGPCVIEPLEDIALEVAVIVARSTNGELSTFDAVTMDFHPTANLVEWLVCPSGLSAMEQIEAEALAVRVTEAYQICGLLAVELFLTRDGRWLVNEVAPRPHNSGHHTIEACITSQFQQHLRAICGLPLGDTTLRAPAVMVNLLGEAGYTGPVQYLGAETCLAMKGVNIHLYGKQTTKPFRKMGHATIIGDTLDEAREKARIVKDTFKIIA
jgi:5-(carboxyamino)imidazole ribonucleotide synthase